MRVSIFSQIRAKNVNIYVVVSNWDPCTSIVVHTIRFDNIVQVDKIGHWELLIFFKNTAGRWQNSVLKNEFIGDFKVDMLQKFRFNYIRVTNNKIWDTLFIFKWQLRKSREGDVITWLNSWLK